MLAAYISLSILYIGFTLYKVYYTKVVFTAMYLCFYCIYIEVMNWYNWAICNHQKTAYFVYVDALIHCDSYKFAMEVQAMLHVHKYNMQEIFCHVLTNFEFEQTCVWSTFYVSMCLSRAFVYQCWCFPIKQSTCK